MPSTLYSIVHVASGREYIGVTSRSLQERWQKHCKAEGGCPRLHRAIRKYGVDAFTFQVLAELPTSAEGLLAERIAIALYRPAFNLTVGGEGAPGAVRSDVTRERMSAAKRGIATRPKGFKHSPETRAKMRAARALQAPHTPESLERAKAKRARYRHPPEVCARIRESLMGNVRSVGRVHSPETRAKMSQAQRAAWVKRRTRC